MYITDLPGKQGKHEVARFANSANAAIQMICAGAIATTANDHGAIDAYRDDSGVLRGRRYFYMRTCEDRTFRNLKTLARWYSRALRRIE